MINIFAKYIVLPVLAVLIINIFFLRESEIFCISKEDNLSSSVSILAKGSQGSGVVFNNGLHNFVWTCAHVVVTAREQNVVVNTEDNKISINTHFEYVEVKQKFYNEERNESGYYVYWGNVIRYNAQEDIALIQLMNNKVIKGTVRFVNPSFVVKPWVKVYHIGSHFGWEGHNTCTAGNGDSHGRERNDSMFDTVCLNYNRGCSGGGVFEENTGLCIGLMSRTVDMNINLCQGLIIPSRRIHDFCQKLDCLWAYDNKIPVPENTKTKLSNDVLVIPDNILKYMENGK